MSVGRAGVTQLAECLLPKQDVAGSNPVSRSNSSPKALFLRASAERVLADVNNAAVRRHFPEAEQ